MSWVGTSQADNMECNLAIAVWWIAVAALDHDCLFWHSEANHIVSLSDPLVSLKREDFELVVTGKEISY